VAAAVLALKRKLSLPVSRMMLDRVQTMARELAAVATENAEALAADILGELQSNIDMESLLERADTMNIELTADEIDAATPKASPIPVLDPMVISQPVLADAGLAWGFCIGQSATLARIAQIGPSWSAEVAEANLAFRGFARPCDDLDAFMRQPAARHQRRLRQQGPMLKGARSPGDTHDAGDGSPPAPLCANRFVIVPHLRAMSDPRQEQTAAPGGPDRPLQVLAFQRSGGANHFVIHQVFDKRQSGLLIDKAVRT
jgi:hypothetical protein